MQAVAGMSSPGSRTIARVNPGPGDRSNTRSGTLLTTGANFAYVSGSRWGVAIYLASKDGYEDSVLPSAKSPEEALDCACGLYLNEPQAWSEASRSSPKNF